MSSLAATSRPAATVGTIQKAAVLLYGTVVYALFLPTFVYAVGFMTGIAVPKAINDGAVGAVGTAILVDTLLLGLFAVQHMIMARPAFKRRWTKIIPKAAERSTFVLATCLILNLLYWQWRPIPGELWHADGVFATVLTAVSLAGWGIVLVATFLIDHFDLFGLKQVIRFAHGKPEQSPPFLVRSLYKYIRHPLYLGFLIAFWATPVMTYGHLLFALATTGFVLIAVRLEERDLRDAHPEYNDYAASIPMIIPTPGRKFNA